MSQVGNQSIEVEILGSKRYVFKNGAGAEATFREPTKPEVDMLRAWWNKSGKMNLLYVSLNVGGKNEPTDPVELLNFRTQALYSLFQFVMKERDA